jgi:hypothetical protein
MNPLAGEVCGVKLQYRAVRAAFEMSLLREAEWLIDAPAMPDGVAQRGPESLAFSKL